MNEEDDQWLDLGLACQGIKIAAVRNGSEILKVVDVYSRRSGHGKKPGRRYRVRPADLDAFNRSVRGAPCPGTARR